MQQLIVPSQINTILNTGSYGFIYESFLTIALTASSKLQIGLDTQNNFLAELAFWMYSSNENYVSIDNLKKFDSDDYFVNAMALGAIGDSYMELNDTDNALKYYLKAANNNDNSFTSPLFLMKAGSTYELSGNYTEAVKLYERIQKEYYKSYESREIEKYIARAKSLMSEK